MAQHGSRRRRPILLGPVAASLMLGLAATALAVPVRGRLVLPNDFAGPASTPADGSAPYWRVWNGFLEPVEGTVEVPRAITVVLTGATEGPVRGCDYRLSGGDFLPSTMVVKEGEPLRVTNTDGIVYQLASTDLPGFPEVPTQPGNALRAPVATGGPYTIGDRNLPHVRGFVLTLPDLAACGAVDAEGNVRFDDVDPGDYTLRVYRDGVEIAHTEARVDVSRGRREVALEPLNLPAPGTE